MSKRNLANSLNWSLLQVLISIHEEGSLSGAADSLNITQSAVSQSLKRLEEQVGSQLVIRSSKPIRFTAIGNYCLKVAQTVFTEITSIEAMKDSESHLLEGEIKLLVASRIHDPRYNSFLVYFRRKYPNITLNLIVKPSTEIHESLMKKTKALGICLANHIPDDLNSELLFNQRFYLYCGYYHPLYSKTDITMEDILTQDLISFNSEEIGDVLSSITIFKEAHDFVGRTSAYTNNLDEAVRLIYTGYGIGALPEQFVTALSWGTKLKKMPPKTGIADVPIYILWHKHRALSSIESQFLKELIDYDSLDN